jgi:hypothetical protein
MQPSVPQTAPERQKVVALLARLDKLSILLDSKFRVPGTPVRFGLDSIIGFVPVAGDVAGALLSLYFIYEAWKISAPRALIMQMARNVAVELAGGAMPVLGDMFDIYWKSNRRNVLLLRNHLQSLLPAEKEEKPKLARAFVSWLVPLMVTLGIIFTFYWLSVKF